MGRWLAVTLAAVAAFLPASSIHNGIAASALAAQAVPVAAWAQVSSVTPAAGCSVGASIEVRQDGNALPAAEVGVALVLDGEILSADRGLTGDDGIAYLGVDTGWAQPGREAWLDVLIGGAYAGGMPVSITESGGCDDNPRLIEVSGAVPLAATDESWGAGSVPDGSAGNVVSFYVPTYVQQRNLSCEYASLAIAMGAYGVWVSEYEFDERVGWSENPHWGYRGDITGWWGNTDDYGVYAEPLSAARRTSASGARSSTAAATPRQLTAHLDAGHPTLVWIGLWGDTSYYDYTADGTPFKLAPGMHVVVAYGYDDGGVYVSDPATRRHPLLRLGHLPLDVERLRRHGPGRRTVLAQRAGPVGFAPPRPKRRPGGSWERGDRASLLPPPIGGTGAARGSHPAGA